MNGEVRLNLSETPHHTPLPYILIIFIFNSQCVHECGVHKIDTCLDPRILWVYSLDYIFSLVFALPPILLELPLFFLQFFTPHFFCRLHVISMQLDSFFKLPPFQYFFVSSIKFIYYLLPLFITYHLFGLTLFKKIIQNFLNISFFIYTKIPFKSFSFFITIIPIFILKKFKRCWICY